MLCMSLFVVVRLFHCMSERWFLRMLSYCLLSYVVFELFFELVEGALMTTNESNHSEQTV